MQTRFRKNQRDMTASEWKAFTDAVKAIRLTDAASPNFTEITGYHHMSQHQHTAHAFPTFLPWHREFLYVFETRLRQVNPSVTIPYWDWSVDREIPAPLKNMEEWEVNRSNNEEIPTVLFRENVIQQLNRIMSHTDFRSFHNDLNGIHGAVHVSIGGIMGDIQRSPEDILFWLHHAFIDKIWADWQAINPGVNPTGDQITAALIPTPAFTRTSEQVFNTANLGVYYANTEVIAEPVGIRNRYVWLPELRSCPVEISYDVTCNSFNDEFLPVFSRTKAQWWSPDCDALCWYLSPHRRDFTFRTKLFGSFPRITRSQPGILAEVGRTYNIKCSITETSASYYIDGKWYATATYPQGTVPAEGFFGFAIYRTEDILVENIRIATLTTQAVPELV